jgi:hypothetical protein
MMKRVSVRKDGMPALDPARGPERPWHTPHEPYPLVERRTTWHTLDTNEEFVRLNKLSPGGAIGTGPFCFCAPLLGVAIVTMTRTVVAAVMKAAVAVL